MNESQVRHQPGWRMERFQNLASVVGQITNIHKASSGTGCAFTSWPTKATSNPREYREMFFRGTARSLVYYLAAGMSHILIVLSRLPEASVLASGLNTTGVNPELSGTPLDGCGQF